MSERRLKRELLILAGFMGTGKSTVGQLCAKSLGYDFIDADAEIERRADMSIAQIFEQQGEVAFRRIEADLVRELVMRRRTVIATGGGMMVEPTNRHALLQAGTCVCLTASPEVIVQRVDADTRPMLRGGAVRERVAKLLKERESTYQELHYQVDTSNCTPEETAAQVLTLYGAEWTRFRVNTPPVLAGLSRSNYYDIVFGCDILDQLGSALSGRGWSVPFAIISDEIVSPLYAQRIRANLEHAGISAFIHTIPPGEANKTLVTVEDIYRDFSEHGLERGGVVLAVGGGIVGDVAGFAAATYLRGVSFIQVPTTLLAMADSSIGGKVGVDTAFGKNLVGAFKQPELVAIDTDCLSTLPFEELSNGYAEIIKAALISGGDSYARVCAHKLGPKSDNSTPFGPGGEEWIIEALLDAIELKRRVVEEDPFEKGRRAILNLGHTFGHGIEAWSHFSIKHGQAVALGMLCAARLSSALGLCDKALPAQVKQLLDGSGLPVRLPAADAEAIWALMQSDKKRRDNHLRFVLMHGPGDVIVYDGVSAVDAKRVLMTLGEE